jgi:probable rRNA maturation factor
MDPEAARLRRRAPARRRAARPSLPLRVLVADGRGRRAAAPGLAGWLTRVAPAKARGAVGIALVSDSLVRRLNRDYRGHDYATDVLSFPADDLHSCFPHPAPSPLHATRYLGDIVIARGVARRQARDAGHSERVELRVLALHGLLHLLGFDHERDTGQMRRVEARLRRKGGLRQGLIERERPRAGRR